MIGKLKKRMISVTVVLAMMFGLAAPVYAAGMQPVPAASEELPVIELLPGQTLEEALALENAAITLSKGATQSFTSAPGNTSYPPTGAVSRVYVWSVSSNKILSIVSSNGNTCTVRGVAAGTATVSCKVTLTYTSYTPGLGTQYRSEQDFGGTWQINVVDGSSSGSSGSSSGSSSSGGAAASLSSGLNTLVGGAALMVTTVVLYKAVKGLLSRLPSAREAEYAAVYDYRYYRENNADLEAAFGSDRAAYLEHFLTKGMAEGRQASESFNVNVYRAQNPDLNAAFGSDLAAYYQHYIQSGQAEGRIAR